LVCIVASSVSRSVPAILPRPVVAGRAVAGKIRFPHRLTRVPGTVYGGARIRGSFARFDSVWRTLRTFAWTLALAVVRRGSSSIGTFGQITVEGE